MAAPPEPQLPPRERFVREAARLFAERGYAATSVGDIQQACGLTRGSGALYKHFPSKRALLGEVIGMHIGTMRAGEAAERLPDDLADALRLVVQLVWGGMRRDHQVLRVMLRDLDEHPDLLAEVWEEVRRSVYDEFTRWLDHRTDIRVTDPAATSAVLLAALTYYPILDTLIGHTPGDLEADRFAEAWVAQALAVLRGGAGPAPDGRDSAGTHQHRD